MYKTAYDEIVDILQIEPDDFRLEEVEYDSDRKVESVVVSYLIKRDTPPLEEKLGLPYYLLQHSNHAERQYKKLKFNNKEVVKGVYMYNS